MTCIYRCCICHQSESSVRYKISIYYFHKSFFILYDFTPMACIYIQVLLSAIGTIDQYNIKFQFTIFKSSFCIVQIIIMFFISFEKVNVWVLPVGYNFSKENGSHHMIRHEAIHPSGDRWPCLVLTETNGGIACTPERNCPSSFKDVSDISCSQTSTDESLWP